MLRWEIGLRREKIRNEVVRVKVGSERNISKSKGESSAVAWACEKGRKLCGKKSDGDGDSRKEKER